MLHHTVLLSLLASWALAQNPGDACYGNVAYCVAGPIILRCSGTTLGPGNCDDNLNHPQFGALCIQSAPKAGNAICSAVGSPAPAFPSVTGGLGTPTSSPTVSSTSASASATASTSSASGTGLVSTVTVTVTSACSSVTAAPVPVTSTTAAPVPVSSSTTSPKNGTVTVPTLSSASSASSAASTPVSVTASTTKTAAPTQFTGAAVSVMRAGMGAYAVVMGATVLMDTMMAGGGMFLLLV